MDTAGQLTTAQRLRALQADARKEADAMRVEQTKVCIAKIIAMAKAKIQEDPDGAAYVDYGWDAQVDTRVRRAVKDQLAADHALQVRDHTTKIRVFWDDL